jgi:CheY-like chemotaxis protein
MKTIILVEDDPVVVKVYGAMLEGDGFDVVVAKDGLIALRMLAAVKPDVVVLDLMMPKLNGADVLEYIRSTPALQAVPVIILTHAHMTMASLTQQAEAVGADKALLKSSCTPIRLMGAIEDLLSGTTVAADHSKRIAVRNPPRKPQT